MKLIDITKDNGIEVIFLTTTQKVTIQGSREPYDAGDMPTLCEDFVASNALSIVQSVFENGWITKAIEHEGELIGFTIYGYGEGSKRIYITEDVGLVGIIFVVLGYLIWKKEKISLLHDYHYDKVSPEDKK